MITLLMAAMLGTTAQTIDEDPYLWLEEVEGEKALAWVRSHNERTRVRLEKDPRYAPTEKAIREITLAEDRVPMPTLRGGWVYNFWQDDTNVRGLWRRTRLDEYRKEKPQWEVVLDVDELARRESENWVWHAAEPLPPDGERCLVTLSRGGKDADVVREFDVATKKFVEGGFTLPEAKSTVAWIDRDTIFVGTDFGPGSLTDSGYPRVIKVWKRGTPLEKATTVFEGDVKDVAAFGTTLFRPEGNVSFVGRWPAFFKSEYHLFRDGRKGGHVPIPDDANVEGLFEGRLFVLLRSDWKPAARTFVAGSVVALPLSALDDPAQIELVLEPTEHTSIQGVGGTRHTLFASVVEDVKGRVLRLERAADGKWSATRQPYPDYGAVGVVSADDFSDEMVVSYASFLVPDSLYLSNHGGAPEPLKQSPVRFDPKGLTVEQFFATSRDGTRIPYFVVRPEKIAADGAPTLLNGYGGFEVTMSPFYLGNTGKVWSEKGGIYVLANLRGGGEYGPKWHEAVLKENRPKVYEDFIAVAEDLIARKITTPSRLAITGGSNGGLLMGAAFTKRPDLFAAVLCEVPLLDMLRYTKLLAGASWAAEYGDPEDPAMRAVIRSYSPYQNVSRDKKYPEVFFYTSTKDDRVHPGHARKMAAKMEEMGHPIVYFENIEGGHGAAANLEQYIERRTRLTVFLYQKLMDVQR
jgi:prolyl oligopeptidase